MSDTPYKDQIAQVKQSNIFHTIRLIMRLLDKQVAQYAALHTSMVDQRSHMLVSRQLSPMIDQLAAYLEVLEMLADEFYKMTGMLAGTIHHKPIEQHTQLAADLVAYWLDSFVWLGKRENFIADPAKLAIMQEALAQVWTMITTDPIPGGILHHLINNSTDRSQV